MSEAEMKAKPIILGLMSQELTGLTSEQSTSLARWIAVKIIVAEHAEEGNALTPEADRRALFEKERIPKFFRIFIARHSLISQTGYFRQSTTMAATRQGPSPPLPADIGKNVSITLFLVGTLFIYVSAVQSDELEISLLDPSLRMAQLWPTSQREIFQDELPAFNGHSIDTLQRTLDSLIANPRVRYGGNLENNN
jgi:hypothetical protein